MKSEEAKIDQGLKGKFLHFVFGRDIATRSVPYFFKYDTVEYIVSQNFPKYSNAEHDLFFTKERLRDLKFSKETDVGKIPQYCNGEFINIEIRPKEKSFDSFEDDTFEIITHDFIKSEIESRKGEMKKVILEEIEHSMKIDVSEVVEEEKKDELSTGWEILENTFCSGCGSYPIQYPIYICGECTEEKICLCKKCDDKDLHSHHALIQVKNTEQMKAMLTNVAIIEDHLRNQQQVGHTNQGDQQHKEISLHSYEFKKPEKKRNFLGQFFHGTKEFFKKQLVFMYPQEISEPLDGSIRYVACEPNDTAFSYWSILNKSSMFWPTQVKISFELKDHPLEEIAFLNIKVPPGSIFDFTLPVQAPAKEGSYVIVVRIKDQENYPIGKKLRIVLTVSSKFKKGVLTHH